MARLPSMFTNLRPYEAIARDQHPSADGDDDGTVATVASTDDELEQRTDPPSFPSVESLRRRSSVSPRAAKDVELALSVAGKQLELDEGDDSSPKEDDPDCIGEEEEPIDPFSKDYVGITASYFTVGLMIGGSLSLLYPVLVVKGGATSSLMAASQAVIMVFWSYKIFFGFLSDCFPIFGYKRKPYMIVGWFLCASVLMALAWEGNDVDPRKLVICLSLANLGYVWADTAADGFMVTIAHREPIEGRGKTQTFCYSMMKLGQIVVNVVLLLGMSGPEMNCPGYEPDDEIPCSTDEKVMKRVDQSLLDSNPTDWCHEQCSKATLPWDLSITTFALSICFAIATAMKEYV